MKASALLLLDASNVTGVISPLRARMTLLPPLLGMEMRATVARGGGGRWGGGGWGGGGLFAGAEEGDEMTVMSGIGEGGVTMGAGVVAAAGASPKLGSGRLLFAGPMLLLKPAPLLLLSMLLVLLADIMVMMLSLPPAPPSPVLPLLLPPLVGPSRMRKRAREPLE